MYVYGRGRGGGWGRGRGGTRGMWPGNGPFSHLPPWGRPGWLYGPGSCWTMGYWGNLPQTAPVPPAAAVPQVDNVEALRQQKEFLENQLKGLQETIDRISQRLDDLSEQ
ncbi:hypothetical protein EU519_01170 [Candidatus Thorarchaeota archaeon]|nr:MAG: hypothetical protein EU519_01170 [Candidatus Thorarchaeota archaeon]